MQRFPLIFFRVSLWVSISFARSEYARKGRREVDNKLDSDNEYSFIFKLRYSSVLERYIVVTRFCVSKRRKNNYWIHLKIATDFCVYSLVHNSTTKPIRSHWAIENENTWASFRRCANTLRFESVVETRTRELEWESKRNIEYKCWNPSAFSSQIFCFGFV